MAYVPTLWEDRVVDSQTGEVLVAGTPVNETNLNKMEEGILAANMTALEAAQVARYTKDKAEELTGEKITVSLTNALQYPFNNSKTTISLSKNRNTKNYTVLVEVVSSSGGGVGDIVISDKLLNGFKVEHTGGAVAVTLYCYVQGGTS